MSAEFQIVNFSFISFLAFAWSIAAFGSMLIIAGRQEKQTEDLALITKEIENMITVQNRIINDVREVYASGIVEYIQRTSKSYHVPILLYINKYKNGISSPRKKEIVELLMSYYDRHLFHLPPIESMELVKTFGRNMMETYRQLTPYLKSDYWRPDTDERMALMMSSYKEQMFKLLELKDAFLQFCDQNVKDKEQECQENYDFIIEEWENAR